VEDLCEKIEKTLQVAQEHHEQPVGIKSSIQSSEGRKPRILGVFTGQGAQTARMGAALLETSEAARIIIGRLEERLARLPRSDRPSWSLKQELLCNDPARISQATLSQPLCTAVQILQIDLLRAAAIEFSAVVGHSSGEIGAAYCAGLISAEDAICIAYYRGFHAALAGGPSGQCGAMLAVGTTFEDAQNLCNEAQFQGRVSVAAVNSPVSVTLSGDEGAVLEIQTIFEDERKSTRLLKVDKAYHSHHMIACSNAYLKSTRALRIRTSNATEVAWFSSVNGGRLISAEDTSQLEATYWNDNMTSPVLFMQAIEGAWKSNGPFDLAIEVGPHPALKGPVLQTIQDLCTKTIPYTGVFARGRNAVETFSDALGYIWAHLNVGDFAGYEKAVTGVGRLSLVKGLPSYAWDHEKEYWHESRYTRAIRNRSGPLNELLGHLAPDATHQDLRWRNILCPKELPWLSGHALQNQIVFPAAGYVVSALEAAVAMCQWRHAAPSVIELLNLDIGKALAFDSEETRIDIVYSLTNITQHDHQIIEAVFKVNATDTMNGDSLNLLATGLVRVTLGDDDTQFQLSSRGPREPNITQIDSDDFYNSLLDLEYQYTGPFRALTDLERKYGYSTGFITNKPTELMIHPAVLDAAIQSLLLCHSAPGSGGLWSLHVPKTIRAVRVDPHLCAVARSKNAPLPFDAQQSTGVMVGDVDVFFDGSQCAMLQIEGLECVPFSRATEKDDKGLFSTTVWDVATPDAGLVAYDGELTEDRLQLASLLERTSIFFLRQLDAAFPSHHPARREGPYTSLFEFATRILSLSRENKLPFWSPGWADDLPDTLAVACEPYSHVIDMKLLREIGENLIDIVRGDKQAIEVGMKDGMLSEFYSDGMGMQENTAYLARLVKQIAHRYPHMNILEVGAGTGGVTKRIFQETRHRFASYNFTDISSGFFEAARQVPQFEPCLSKMNFEVLDISKDPCQQGFTEHSYDLIIASAVIHASKFTYPKFRCNLTLHSTSASRDYAEFKEAN
jgi:hybrid polyketide synthase/nonribosomal peptide synthetase ACE1